MTQVSTSSHPIAKYVVSPTNAIDVSTQYIEHSYVEMNGHHSFLIHENGETTDKTATQTDATPRVAAIATRLVTNPQIEINPIECSNTNSVNSGKTGSTIFENRNDNCNEWMIKRGDIHTLDMEVLQVIIDNYNTITSDETNKCVASEIYSNIRNGVSESTTLTNAEAHLLASKSKNVVNLSNNHIDENTLNLLEKCLNFNYP